MEPERELDETDIISLITGAKRKEIKQDVDKIDDFLNAAITVRQEIKKLIDNEPTGEKQLEMLVQLLFTLNSMILSDAPAHVYMHITNDLYMRMLLKYGEVQEQKQILSKFMDDEEELQ